MGGALLQHGSIVISGDQTLLSKIGLSESPPAGHLSEQIGAVHVERVANAVIGSMETILWEEVA